MTAVITDPAEVLEKAADEIERRGLYRGAYFDPCVPDTQRDTCRVCALGAIGLVIQDSPELYHDLITFLDARPALEALARETGQVWDGDEDLDDHDLHERITEWSDGRDTAAEVADAMRTTARHLREGGVS